MLLLASGYILYDTSATCCTTTSIGQHVAASLALFASVALMFWYMVQLVMSLNVARSSSTRVVFNRTSPRPAVARICCASQCTRLALASLASCRAAL